MIQNNMTKSKVIIIGAGLAGLAAAYELSKQKNVYVSIFEAASEVGGRVKSIAANGHLVDVGGFIIYPWYTQYHRFIKELHLEKKLQKIKDVNIYYQLDPTGGLCSEDKLPVSMVEKLQFGKKILPHFILSRPDFRAPDLKGFGSKTVAEFLPNRNSNLAKFIDCLNQGYCYASPDVYQMAFYAPFVYQTLVHGDLRTGFYFGGNNQLFATALAKAIKKNGGKIICNAEVKKVTNKKITVKGKEHDFDAVIFANQVGPLYKKIIKAKSFVYTHFYAAVVKLPKPLLIQERTDWTAVFVAPITPATNQITSLIRAQGMVSKLGPEYLIINFKTATDKPMSKIKFTAELNQELKRLFPKIGKAVLVNSVYWPQTMPIATTEFVAEVRSKQGIGDYYFAGDYLGAPSMETAVSSGIETADALIKKLKN